MKYKAAAYTHKKVARSKEKKGRIFKMDSSKLKLVLELHSNSVITNSTGTLIFVSFVVTMKRSKAKVIGPNN